MHLLEVESADGAFEESCRQHHTQRMELYQAKIIGAFSERTALIVHRIGQKRQKELTVLAPFTMLRVVHQSESHSVWIVGSCVPSAHPVEFVFFVSLAKLSPAILLCYSTLHPDIVSSAHLHDHLNTRATKKESSSRGSYEKSSGNSRIEKVLLFRS